MAKKVPSLVDRRLLKALANQTRVHILDILSEGPSSPSRIQKRMPEIALNLVCYHIKILRDLDCIELIDEVRKRGATEHIYRAKERQFFNAEEWKLISPKARNPITSTILRLVSEDTEKSLEAGKFDERDNNHLSRSPVELDEEGWIETTDAMADCLQRVLEAHARSVERAAKTGDELLVARVVMMQFLLNREKPIREQVEEELEKDGDG